MQPRSARRTATFLIVAALMATAAGCQTVKAGTRCRADAGTARDATHVMVCKNGRWTRLMTIGQAAQAIISLQPSFIEAYAPGERTIVGSSTPGTLSAHVLRGGGMAAAVGASVTFALPTNGPGGTIIGSATAQTNEHGIATVKYAPNTIAGSFTATASVGSLKPIAIPGYNHHDVAASVEVVSGANQTTSFHSAFPQYFVARILDRFGNAVTNEDLLFDYDPSMIEVVEYVGPSDWQGKVSFRAEAVGFGHDTLYVGVELADGSFSVAEFPFTIA